MSTDIPSAINKPVFFTAFLITFALSLAGIFIPEVTNQLFGVIQHWIVINVGWVYMLSVALFLIFLVFMMCSRLGDIKLGPDHIDPEYSLGAWIAMLFSAGMGIGLMFFAVTEPLMHFLDPPTGDPQSIASARGAMVITFFHWGLNAWAIYGVFALAMAYFCYRHHLPLLPRSALYPLIGERIFGPIGHVVDSFAVIATIVGIATSLGFGVIQLNAGLQYLFGWPVSLSMQLFLIACVTGLAIISLVLGLDGGIKRLSNINMGLAILLMAIVIVLGPTSLIMQSFVQNIGGYLSDIVNKTFNLYAYQPKPDWIGGWTLLYWGWWLSWAPFVGVFIARISKGRTIREFVVGVLLIPSAFGFLWFTCMGNTAIHAVMDGTGQALVESLKVNQTAAFFHFFELFPFSFALSLLAVCLIVTFFVSSSDSGSLVVDTLTSGGHLNPPVWQRVFWAITEAVVAAALLVAGGLQALQTVAIVSALPVMILMLFFCYSLLKALRTDYLLLTSVQHHKTSVQFSKVNIGWREHIAALVHQPEKMEARQFISKIATPALTKVAEEMRRQDVEASIEVEQKDRCRLVVLQEGIEDFAYGIRLREFVFNEESEQGQEVYFRAEVFLAQGGQQYDVLGYNEDQIIADVITQFERHLHYIHLSTAENLEV